MNLIAAIRPDDWNFPLFVHVLGAMILVGGTLTAAAALAFARGEERLLRLGYWSLLAVALPGYVLMRIGGQWIYSKEGLDDAPIEAAWTGIGFVIADPGRFYSSSHSSWAGSECAGFVPAAARGC